MALGSLHYAKVSKRQDKIARGKRAIDIIYDKMVLYDGKAREYLEQLKYYFNSTDKAMGKAVIEVAKLMKECDVIALDCAHKLAPYQSPKLESLEVKGTTEHRFVMRAPSPAASLDAWMVKTGASMLNTENLKKVAPKGSDPIPSIHDFDEITRVDDTPSLDSDEDYFNNRNRDLN